MGAFALGATAWTLTPETILAKDNGVSPPAPPVSSTTAAATTPVDLKKVRESIVSVIESDAEQRGDGTSLYGTMIRLAWHCSGTYSATDGSGGCNGARMRFDPERQWGANAGLAVARDALEPVKAQFPTLSYADLYTYAGVVAVEEAGGPTIPFRGGRTDAEHGETSPPDGRLPDADKGSRVATIHHVREIFYRMGFTDQEIVALSGALLLFLLLFFLLLCRTVQRGSLTDLLYWCYTVAGDRRSRHGSLPHGSERILGTLDQCGKHL